MTDFKVGDKVRYIGEDYEGRKGKTGEIDRIADDFSGILHAYVTWEDGRNAYTFPFLHNLELVQPEYDKATVEAIAAHLRKQGYSWAPTAIETAFDELTAPRTHKVVVEFEVEDGEDLVAILDRTDIDYTIKED